MKPVYGVDRAVEVGKLNKSLCLSLQYGDEHFSGGDFPRDESTNHPERDRQHEAGTKKKRHLHF
jgi:hypothetical protein